MRFIAAVLFFCSLSSAYAHELIGRVVGISDGDTLTLLVSGRERQKVRLAGIDAPEKSQPFGQRSKEWLSALAYNDIVSVTWNKRDRYGRILWKVLHKGTDVNLEMVVSGLAWHYKHYEMEQPAADRRAYALAEDRARSAHLGLWVETNPIPPWNYRRGVR